MRVNFIALVIKLIRTWRTRLGSRSVQDTFKDLIDGSSIIDREVEARFSSASNIFSADRIKVMGCEGSGETSNKLESRRDRVRMSSIIRFWCMAQ